MAKGTEWDAPYKIIYVSLSEQTWRIRRNLMILSMLSIIFSLFGADTSNLNVLGVDFENLNRNVISFLLFLLVIYKGVFFALNLKREWGHEEFNRVEERFTKIQSDFKNFSNGLKGQLSVHQGERSVAIEEALGNIENHMKENIGNYTKWEKWRFRLFDLGLPIAMFLFAVVLYLFWPIEFLAKLLGV